MHYSIRSTTRQDIPAVMEIIEQAKQFLKEQGLTQWQNGYPNSFVIEKDIELCQSYLTYSDSNLVGTFCLCFTKEASYETIYDGAWLNQDKPYAALHRIATSTTFRKSGVASYMVEQAQKLAKQKNAYSLRVDTHCGNIPMQNMLQKNGFIPCGIIYLTPEKNEVDIRMAFEKILSR